MFLDVNGSGPNLVNRLAAIHEARIMREPSFDTAFRQRIALTSVGQQKGIR